MKKKIKKILFVEFFPIGGSTTGLISQLHYLGSYHRSQYRPVVVTSANSILKPDCEKNGIKVYVYPKEACQPGELSYPTPKNIFRYLFLLFYLLGIVIKENPALIHCYHYFWSIYANPVGFLTGKQVVIHLKDVWFLQPKFARIAMKFNPRTRYIAVSKFVFSLFTKKYKLRKDRTSMIYDGIDNTNFVASTVEEIKRKNNNKEKIIMYNSRIAPERDIEVFIETAAILLKKFPNLKFVHWGYHPIHSNKDYFNKLNELVKNLKIESKFKFYKHKDSQRELTGFIKSTYLSVIPARQFAFPNVAIESMMCGTPVIALDTGGNSEIVADKGVGDLVKNNLAILYADRVEDYLTGKKNYVSTAINAVSYSQKFNAQKQFDNLIKFYGKILI